MQQSYEKFRSVRFFGSLDGLRALSIVAVMWLHAWWETPYYARLEAIPVLRQGFYGVQVFFVVSGFLITTLLLREMEKYGTISLRDFYIRRALRIWPLYYAVLGIYVVNALVFERGTQRAASFLHYLPSFATFTYTWFLSANWPGGMFNLAWTLSTEEQFYFFWPVVLRILRGIWSAAVIVGLIALKLATDYHLTDQVLPPGWLPTRIVQSIAIPICLGVLLGPGVAQGTRLPANLSRAGLEVVCSGDAGGDASVPCAGSSAVAGCVFGNDGAGGSVRSARRQRPGLVAATEAGGVRGDGELWDVFAEQLVSAWCPGSSTSRGGGISGGDIRNHAGSDGGDRVLEPSLL